MNVCCLCFQVEHRWWHVFVRQVFSIQIKQNYRDFTIFVFLENRAGGKKRPVHIIALDVLFFDASTKKILKDRRVIIDYHLSGE